ncbi:MAG: SIS domain-containing protein [Bryobacteraceae bacterium]
MSYCEQYQREVLKAIGSIPLDKVELAIRWFTEARSAGRQIFVCGNGGSAANASHFACEVLKGASYGRPARFRIQALTDSVPTITAYANDVGYETAFVEQLKNFAQPGDIVIGLSGSGNSMSVVRAVEYANSIGCRTLTLTGFDGGRLAPLGQLNIHIPMPHIGRSEEAQLAVLHMISYYFMDETTAGEAQAGD